LNQGTHHAVDGVLLSPLWDSTRTTGDAALLHLSSPAAQTPLPVIGDATLTAVAPGASARVLGWGVTDPANPGLSSELQQVDVPIVDDARCANAYGAVLFDRRTMLCAGLAEGGKDSCQGDSGGPLMVDTDPGDAVAWQLAGIVSFGDGCAQPGAYGVYTRLTNATLRAWIARAVAPAAGQATGTGTPAPTPAATPSPAASTAPATAPDGAAAPRATPDFTLPSHCSGARCGLTVELTSPGTVHVELLLTRHAARWLHLRHRTVAHLTRALPGSRTTLRVAVPASVRHALRRRGRHGVTARLSVRAGGAHASRLVRLRR
jgi:hypothetical protein